MSTSKLFSRAGTVTGYILGLLGSIITILAIDGQVIVAWRWIVITAIVVLFIIIFAFIAFLSFKKILKEDTRFQVDSYDNSDEKDYFYIQFSKMFRYQALVSIYVIIDGVSRRMGFGLVSNVSDDEYIEIEIVKIFEGYEIYFEKAKSSHKKALEKMYIIPTIYSENVQCIYNSMQERGNHCG